MTKSLLEMAADIVKSQCQGTSMSTEDVAVALNNTFQSLQELQAKEARAEAEETGVAQGAAPRDIKPEKSILKNKIICLECGESFKMLSPKHLASHDLDGRSYRQKYGLSLRQPLCAKALSEKRKKAAKERGLPENLRKAIEARKTKKGAKKSTAKPRKKK
ncbi:MAG: transcriptional regulator [Desulfobulbaceae bacterium]|nr:MAG: transcriptional regulator [Desulfobulbaceae bacterium]